MVPHMIMNPNKGMVCDKRISPAAMTARTIIVNWLNGTGDHVEKPAGNRETSEKQHKADKSTWLKDWFVCIAHVSYLLPSNMRHVLGVVNGD